jgi:hypothetical protein
MSEEEIIQFDKFIDFALNVDIIDFRNDFYKGKWDSKVQNNVMMMRNNFSEFWSSLDNKKKKKYLELVNKYYETD